MQENNHLIKSWTSLQFNSIYKIYCLESDGAYTTITIATKTKAICLHTYRSLGFCSFALFVFVFFFSFLCDVSIFSFLPLFHMYTAPAIWCVPIENEFFKCTIEFVFFFSFVSMCFASINFDLIKLKRIWIRIETRSTWWFFFLCDYCHLLSEMIVLIHTGKSNENTIYQLKLWLQLACHHCR